MHHIFTYILAALFVFFAFVNIYKLYTNHRWHVIREGNHYGVYHPRRRHMWISPYSSRKSAQAECDKLNKLTEADFNWEGKVLANDGQTWVVPGEYPIAQVPA